MRVLALGGAGAVCSEAVRDLAQYSDFDEIVIGEIAVERAEALRQEIGDPRISVMRVDATDHEVMVRVFRHFDVIMNGLPFRFDLAVTRAAVEAGVSGLDLSSEEDQFAYEEEARRKGITFIPGVGATPGVTNIMAAQGVSRMDAVEEIQINFAAFRCLAPAPGLLTTTIWEFHPEQEERAYYEDGQFYPVPPFAGEKTVAFPEPIGEQKVYFVPHDETYTLSASYRDKGLRRVSVRGCFPPHVMRLMRAMLEAGLFGSGPVEVLGTRTTPLEVMEQLLLALPVSRENPLWAYGLVVEVWGQRDGREVKATYWNTHPPQEVWGGKTAYYKNIGVPLSIGAQMLAKGQVKAKGVLPPERAIDPGLFFRELARRGIVVHEKIEEYHKLSQYTEANTP